MELRALIHLMIEDGTFVRILNDPMAQFGTVTRNYLGATILPEKKVKANTYKETKIKYRSPIANASTRYSPPSIKGGVLVGSQLVDLGNSDAASEFTAENYDGFLEMLEALPTVSSLSEVPITAMVELLKWADLTLNRPLVEYNEWMRWQAIVYSELDLIGDDGYKEHVEFYAPPGHRVNAAGDWTDDDYDPYPELVAGYQKLVDKEFIPKRLVMPLNVQNTLLGNKQIRMRLGLLSLQNNTLVGLPGNATAEMLNNRLKQDKIPAIETYDLQYRKSVGTDWFLPRQTAVFVGATGEDFQVDNGDQEPLFIEDVAGYVGLGRPANRPASGRAQVVEYNDGKGAPVTGTAWQTSAPVIDNPEAFYVINEIDTQS